MKKFIAIILSIILLNITQPNKVLAQNYTYSRVLTNTTGFYSDAGGNYLKFYLPYGYFVKILEVGPTYTKVSYMNDNAQFPFLTGYIKTVDLIPREDTPLTPYPLLNLTVISDEVLFSDINLTNSKIGVYANTLAVFYGQAKSPNDEELVYVYCNGYLGYMRKSCFAPFTVPDHPEPVISNSYQEELSSSQTKSSTAQTDNLQILIVAGISIIVVSIVYLIFRPGEKKIRENNYEDD